MPLQAILAKVDFTQSEVMNRLESAMNKWVNLAYADFELTVASWKNNRGIFKKSVKVTQDVITGEITANDPRYTYVSEGTKGHYIYPRRARRLAFASKYTAKTQPGSLISKSGGASGNIVFSKGHYVRGITPRKFDKMVKELQEDNFFRIMNAAILKGT